MFLHNDRPEDVVEPFLLLDALHAFSFCGVPSPNVRMGSSAPTQCGDTSLVDKVPVCSHHFVDFLRTGDPLQFAIHQSGSLPGMRAS
jgi:hypothetical protein